MDTKECIEILSEQIEFWEDKIQTCRHDTAQIKDALGYAVKVLKGAKPKIKEPTLF